MSSTVVSAPASRGAVLLPSHFEGRASRVAGAAGAVVPPAVATLCLACIDGHPVPTLILLGLAVAVAALVGHRLSTARIELSADGLHEWSLSARDRHIVRADVAKVVLVTLFVRDSLRTVRSLYLVGADGSTLHRVSGQWWPDAHLTAVSKHFDVPREISAEPLTMPELRRMRLVRLPWHQQHPVLTQLLTTAAVVVCSLAVAAVTSASV